MHNRDWLNLSRLCIFIDGYINASYKLSFFLSVNNVFYFLYYHLWRDACKTMIISSETGLIAKHRTWSASHVELHHISRALSPT